MEANMTNWKNVVTSTMSVGCLAMCLSACATPSNPAQNAVAPLASAAVEGDDVIAVAQEENILEIQFGTVVVGQTALEETDPMICKIEAVTGSRFKEKVCARKSQRDNARDDTRIGLDALHRRSSTGVLRF